MSSVSAKHKRLTVLAEKLEALILEQHPDEQKALFDFYNILLYQFSDIIIALTIYKSSPGEIHALSTLLGFFITYTKPYRLDNGKPRFLTVHEYVEHSVSEFDQMYGIKEFDQKRYVELKTACRDFCRLLSCGNLQLNEIITTLKFIDKLYKCFDYY